MDSLEEFLSLEAECSDDEGEDLAESLFDKCTCKQEICICDKFINDVDSEKSVSASPAKTPWEITRMIELQEEEDLNALFDSELQDEILTPRSNTPENDESTKRLRTITNSMEKAQIEERPKPKKIRNIQSQLLTGGSVEEGIYNYPITQRDNEEITQLIDNSETLLETERNAASVANEVGDAVSEIHLRNAFFKFSCREGQEQLSEKPGARWNDLMRNMKSDKTMQKNWALFFERPVTGLRAGPARSHVAIEALLCSDADGIRAKHSTVFCMYLLEYRNKSRSANGLKKLLAQVDINLALIGVPIMKAPLVRDWIEHFTSVLTEDQDRDLLWLKSAVTPTNTTNKFNPEELICYCEEREPESLEILIANYRQEALSGNCNAQAWIELTAAYNHAQTCFKMWKATVKGKQMQLPLSQYIAERFQQFDEGNHINVMMLLNFQEINETLLLNQMRKWLIGRNKMNVLVFVGPGNSGKSMMAEAITIFLGGAILSVNENNHFWKQGVLGKRYALIDDVTMSQWAYLDQNERRTLDGGLIAVAKKFSDSVETRMPPTLITTNYYLPDQGSQFEFLINRLTWINFRKVLPQRDGLSRIPVTAKDIAAWFHYRRDILDID